MIEILSSFIKPLLGSLIGVFLGAYLSYKYSYKLHVLNERLKVYRELWKLLPSEEYIETCYKEDRKIQDISGSLTELVEKHNSMLAKRMLKLSEEIKSQIIEMGYDIILGKNLYYKVRKFVAETGGWKRENFRERILGRRPKSKWNISEIYEYLLKFTEDTRNLIKKELFKV